MLIYTGNYKEYCSVVDIQWAACVPTQTIHACCIGPFRFIMLGSIFVIVVTVLKYINGQMMVHSIPPPKQCSLEAFQLMNDISTIVFVLDINYCDLDINSRDLDIIYVFLPMINDYFACAHIL